MCLRFLLAPVLALSLLAHTSPTAAEPKPATSALTSPAPALPQEEAAPDSPRASVKRFLDLCRAGEYTEASVYLDLSDKQKADGTVLARRLKAVLDSQIWIKVENISPLPQGDPSDKLPGGVDEIGVVPAPTGPEPVRLVRHHFADGSRWLFSRSTVERVDEWYDHLQDRWLREYLPERLLRPGPQELLWWQWIALPVLFVMALGTGNVLGWLTRKGLARVVSRSQAGGEEALLLRLRGPLALIWAAVAVDLALPSLTLYPPAEAFMGRVLRAGFYAGLFWCAERGVDVAGTRFLEQTATKANAAARSLVPLGARAAKIALLVVAVISALSALGYPVASLVTGLGIGGVAFALAAQKTVENLFGSLSIGVDQPFRVGDFITVDSLSGHVESIGLRSTRIRTPERTLVTIPNGKLADMRIESFAERDRIKLGLTLSLDRGSSAASVREVIEGARALLRKHPKIWPGPTVALAKIAEASLDVEIVAWFQTTQGDEFLMIREEILLDLLLLVEKAGTRLAYPTREIRTPIPHAHLEDRSPPRQDFARGQG